MVIHASQTKDLETLFLLSSIDSSKESLTNFFERIFELFLWRLLLPRIRNWLLISL